MIQAPVNSSTSSKGSIIIDNNLDKIENFMFLSITFLIFKVQKWQTPFWKAYVMRNILRSSLVEIEPFKGHFLAAWPLWQWRHYISWLFSRQTLIWQMLSLLPSRYLNKNYWYAQLWLLFKMYLKIKIDLKDGYLFKTRSGVNYMFNF